MRVIYLKEWECVEVRHHKDVGNTIQRWLEDGWRLHTYTCAQHGSLEVKHYLLFEKEAD